MESATEYKVSKQRKKVQSHLHCKQLRQKRGISFAGDANPKRSFEKLQKYKCDSDMFPLTG